MPRAFDTAKLIPLNDPNRSDINIRDPRVKTDLAQMLIDGVEFIFDAIVGELSALLGFDFTDFLTDAHTILENLQRLFGDLNPFGGQFNLVDAVMALFDILRDAFVTLPMDIIEGLPGALGNLVSNIETFGNMLVGWVAGMPILQQIVKAIVGIPGDLIHLAEWAIDVLTGKSPLFSGNLFGQIESGLIGLIPGAHVAEVSPNLLPDGDFPDAVSLAGDDVWTWDGAAGHTFNGCASVLCDGTTKVLSSNLIPVAEGHVLACSGWVWWTGLVHDPGLHPIRLELLCYQNTGTSSRPSWSQVNTVTLAYDSSGLSGSGWRELAGAHTVTAGVDAVRLQPHVDAVATAGTVKWDDLSLIKTQKMSLGMLDGLVETLDGIWNFIQDIIDGIISAIRLVPIVGAPLADALTALEELVGMTHNTKDLTDNTIENQNNLLYQLLNAPETVLGQITDDLVPGIGHTLENIWAGITGHAADSQVSHSSAQGVLEQSTAALTAAQAEIALLKQALTSGVAVNDTFNREGVIGANWQQMPYGSSVLYPHSGAGFPGCDGNNMAWGYSGNTPHTVLERWVGAGQHSNGKYQAVTIVLGSQGEDPFLGKTSGDQILARVSDDGLNYLRLQINAYVGNPDDPALQLFYAVGGVETRLWWKDVGPVPGSGASITLMAGLKGFNDRTHTIIVNNNVIAQETESAPVSWCSSTPSTMGWGIGQTAGNNFGGFLGIGMRQAIPGKINTWTAQDQ